MFQESFPTVNLLFLFQRNCAFFIACIKKNGKDFPTFPEKIRKHTIVTSLVKYIKYKLRTICIAFFDKSNCMYYVDSTVYYYRLQKQILQVESILRSAEFAFATCTSAKLAPKRQAPYRNLFYQQHQPNSIIIRTYTN